MLRLDKIIIVPFAYGLMAFMAATHLAQLVSDLVTL
jgi:hypothetical protein